MTHNQVVTGSSRSTPLEHTRCEVSKRV